MKRNVLVLFVFLFGVSVAGVSIWRSRPALVTLAAQSEAESQEVVVEERLAEAADEYPLPYPGILPDHPLYFLKMIRDRIQLWLTRDALVRAELMLHFGDKRIASALDLAEKGKAGLASSTATKAEIYLERAVGEAERSTEAGKDTQEFYERFVRASSKHEKVLIGILARVPDEAKSSVEESLEKSRSGYQRAVEVVGEQVQEDEGAVGDSEDALEAGNGQEETEMEGVEGEIGEE